MGTATLPTDDHGHAIQAPKWDWANGEKKAYTDTHGQTGAFTTDLVLVESNTDCFIKFGSSPTASDGSGSIPLAAYTPTTYGFVSGEKVSAVRVATSGAIYVLPRTV